MKKINVNNGRVVEIEGIKLYIEIAKEKLIEN